MLATTTISIPVVYPTVEFFIVWLIAGLLLTAGCQIWFIVNGTYPAELNKQTKKVLKIMVFGPILLPPVGIYTVFETIVTRISKISNKV